MPGLVRRKARFSQCMRQLCQLWHRREQLHRLQTQQVLSGAMLMHGAICYVQNRQLARMLRNLPAQQDRPCTAKPPKRSKTKVATVQSRCAKPA